MLTAISNYDCVERFAPDAEGRFALVEKARAVYKTRRRRDAEFSGVDIFADPAWDMLLTLFIDGELGHDVSVSSACYAAHVPATTALRWVDRLAQRGLISRSADPFDGRRHHLNLTLKGRAHMVRLLSSM
jgi:DNA-binding MarR family transcriptional regulator